MEQREVKIEWLYSMELEVIINYDEQADHPDTEIDVISETSTYKMDTPSKLRKALMRNQLDGDSEMDSDLFSSYSLQSLADNGYKDEETSESLMEDVGSQTTEDSEDIRNREIDSIQEELEQEAPPLYASQTAPAYEADEA